MGKIIGGMKQVWDLFNGNKTAIGGTMLWIAGRVWFVDLVPPVVVDIMVDVGGALTPIGLGHKGVKYVQKKMAAKKAAPPSE